MRAEAFGPRTWLLFALAGWALLFALLAIFGLGGHIAPLPDDPSKVARLPVLRPASPERLGVLGQYGEVTARPPFYDSRRPQPFFISGEGEAQAPSFDFVLTSVLITPAFRMAIVQPTQGGEGVRIRQGEAASAAPQWTLVDLQPRSAVFEGPEGRRTLELRVFNGTGGQAPTVVSHGPAPVAPPPAGPVPGARVTGGNAAARPASEPVTVVPEPPTTVEAPESPAMSTEEQMDAIRKRIEARRAQMRQQQAQPPAPPNNQ
ncbi:MAG TPA: hypothetical protein VM469_08475 [Pseudoxanthomonas sp.]|nr:hypothetical protein [Pseudoxanthomonas sp.]